MQSEQPQGLQDDILSVLYEYDEGHRGTPRMAVHDLREKLSRKYQEITLDLVIEVRSLTEKKLVDHNLTTSGRAGFVWLTTDGRRAASNLPVSDYAAGRYYSLCCPRTMDELITETPDLERRIRNYEINRILSHFARDPECRIILLAGQLSSGVETFEDLHEIADYRFAPIVIEFQGGRTDDLNIFLFDLCDQLAYKVNKYGFEVDFPSPSTEFKGKEEFIDRWKSLREAASNVHLVNVFNNIPANVDPQILDFLKEFKGHPTNGYFILVWPEGMLRAPGEQLRELVGMGQPVPPVSPYPREIVNSIFALVQNYVTIDDDALKYCLALCNRHPFMLRNLVDVILHVANESRLRIEVSNIGHLREDIINKVDLPLRQLYQQLLYDEQSLLWIVSRRHFKPGQQGLLSGLPQVAARWGLSMNPEPDLEKGIAELISRGWAT